MTQSYSDGRNGEKGSQIPRGLPRGLWLLPLMLFPLIVAFHVWRTLGVLESQRELYLRNRVATLAARVESLPAERTGEDGNWLDALYEEEPSLIEAVVIRGPEEDATAAEILAGRQLFRVDSVVVDGEDAIRAWFPVHREGTLRVVRLDFSASAADFLSSYATQSIVLVVLIAAALSALSLYAFQTVGRTAELERRHAAMQHLAKLGEMSAVLAHEIRNPLGSIKGFGQLLAEKAVGKEADFAREIVQQSTRLERLVNDLLLYGRVPEPRFETIQWDDLAARLESAWLAATPGDSVALRVARADVQLRTDPVFLEQALNNLIRNAREALQQHGVGQQGVGQQGVGQHAIDDGQGGTVTVSIEIARNAALIRVEDNGAGLSDEARGRLFEPFFTTKAFGTGLGLPITGKLVMALGGQLRMDAGRERGVCATILLPNVSEG